jgi:hypothetical protein
MLGEADTNTSMPPVLMKFEEMRDSFFPHFENWINLLVGQKGVSLQLQKHRTVAAVIGAAYRRKVNPNNLNEQQWTNIVEFIRNPTIEQPAAFSTRERWASVGTYSAGISRSVSLN